MRNRLKIICLLITTLLFTQVQNTWAQTTDTGKVNKAAALANTQHKKKVLHRSWRDSLRRKILQRDSMIRSFKHSDAALNDLLSKIEDYNSSYVETHNDLENGFDTADISERLPLLEKRMAVMKTTINNSTTMGYIVTIRDMIDHLKEQTATWQTQLNDYSDALDTMRQKITDFNADTTLKVIPADSALMVKTFIRIKDLKQKWAVIDGVTQKAMIRIGLLENRVSALSILLIDLDNRIDQKIHNFTLNAIDNEDGYIWAIKKRSKGADITSALNSSFTLNTKLYRYFFISKANYWAHIFSLLLIPVFFLWIYSSKRKLIRTKQNYHNVFTQTHYVVKYPYLSTILLTCLVAPYFYDHPVQVFTQALLLIMIAALGPVIKGTWPKPLFNLWKLLFALAFVFTISNLMIVITTADRVLMLLLSGLAIYTSVYFLKAIKPAPTDYPPRLTLFIKLFIGFHGVALLLNIFGRFSLSKIIATTATFNLCLAMGLYLLVNILMESLFLQLEANKRTDSESTTSYLEFKVLQKKFKDVVVKVMAVLWLVTLAKNLTIDDYLYDNINDFLNHPYKFNTTVFNFRSVLVFIAIIWLSGLIARVISYFYDFSAQQTKLTPQAKKTRSSILLIRLTVFVIGFFIAINAAGIPMDKVTIVIGALGVGIGFGLQNIVNNLVSGIILAFEKPVQVGDIIEVSGKSGTIKEIGIRSSKIACGDGSELIVPNGDLISQHVVNWTLTDNSRRIELIIGVAYGTDVAKVDALLKNILNTREDVMKTPAPLVFLHNFSDSSVDFRLLFWAAEISTWLSLKSSVMSQIYTEFAKQGIEIPHPKRDIQVFFPEGSNVPSISSPDVATGKTPKTTPGATKSQPDQDQ